MQVTVFDQQGKRVDTMELNPDIFGVKVKPSVVHEVVTLLMSNRRQVYAHTKDRSEVSGGGKKPWAQKKTGRARHGSIRSPIWRKGGRAFATHNDRVFDRKINAKVRKLALFMTLSDKVSQEQMVILQNLQLPAMKTKEMKAVLKNFCDDKTTCLLVLPKLDPIIVKSSANLKGCEVISANSLNVLDILKYKKMMVTADALPIIEKTFLKK